MSMFSRRQAAVVLAATTTLLAGCRPEGSKDDGADSASVTKEGARRSHSPTISPSAPQAKNSEWVIAPLVLDALPRVISSFPTNGVASIGFTRASLSRNDIDKVIGPRLQALDTHALYESEEKLPCPAGAVRKDFYLRGADQKTDRWISAVSIPRENDNLLVVIVLPADRATHEPVESGALNRIEKFLENIKKAFPRGQRASTLL